MPNRQAYLRLWIRCWCCVLSDLSQELPQYEFIPYFIGYRAQNKCYITMSFNAVHAPQCPHFKKLTMHLIDEYLLEHQSNSSAVRHSKYHQTTHRSLWENWSWFHIHHWYWSNGTPKSMPPIAKNSLPEQVRGNGLTQVHWKKNIQWR